MIYNTPIGYAKRVLDLFLFEGENVLFVSLLKILELNEKKILSMSSFEVWLNILNSGIISILEK